MSANPDQHSVVKFHPRQVPTIACVNMATADLGVNWGRLIDALDEYVKVHFAPIWGTPAKIFDAGTINSGTDPKTLFDTLSQKLSGKWGMLFLDDADEPNALGYHDLTPEGLPLGKVFVRTILADHRKVSVTASHELAEMLVDPGSQMGAIGPDGQTWYAYEVADAVEPQYADDVADAVEREEIEIGDIPMSNFVYPAWFEGFRAPNSAQFDHLGICKMPFELRTGGYMPIFKNGNWT